MRMYFNEFSGFLRLYDGICMKVMIHINSTVFAHLPVYVVVQFGFWFNLDFPLFFSMLIYDNEYQTKENPNWTKNQIELQHI